LRAFEPDANEEYTLGAGDEIAINLPGRTDLSSKHVIGPDGRITLDVAGPIKISNLTREQAALKIVAALAPYYTDLTTATVQVISYGSNYVLLLGNVEHPGEIAFDQTPTLLEALSRGGVQNRLDGSVPETCVIYRGDQVLWVDLRQLLETGNPLADLRLRRDDIIFVPALTDRTVSVMGEVEHPGAIVLKRNSTVASIIGEAGGPSEARRHHLRSQERNGQTRLHHAADLAICDAWHIRLPSDGTVVSAEFGFCNRLTNTPMSQTHSIREEHATAQAPPVTADKPSGSPVLPIDLLGNLRRHWLLAASVFVLVMTAGTAVAFRLNKPSYYAESIVYVSPDVPQLLGGDTQIVQPYDSYVDDEAHTVTRYDIIADSIAKLPESIRHRTGPPTPAEVTALQKLLEVSRIGSTFQISIGLHGRKPDNLAGIVNTVTQTFLEDTNDQDFNGRDARLKTLKDDQQQLQSEISGKTAEQMQLMQKLGVATLAAGEGAANPFDAGLETLHTELAAAQMQREAAQAAWISAIGGSGSGQSVALDTAADEAAAQDPGLSSLRTSLNARKAALIAEMSTLTPNHPVNRIRMSWPGSMRSFSNGLPAWSARLRNTFRRRCTPTCREHGRWNSS
jgi:protein involved in polysaccharide export with SLBB domain/capsular polysaccharide biosynthesis protein